VVRVGVPKYAPVAVSADPCPPVVLQHGAGLRDWIAWGDADVMIVVDHTWRGGRRLFGGWIVTASADPVLPRHVVLGAEAPAMAYGDTVDGLTIIVELEPSGAAVPEPALDLSRLDGSVLAELADPRWEFRTVEGLASALGVSETDVEAALVRLGDSVREPVTPDGSGRRLFTIAERRPSWRERYLHLRARLATW
jgi:hypothetical protein